MSNEVKLELPMSQAGIDALLSDLRRHGWGTTARQIEEQLPKPTPPEPKGDAVVLDSCIWIDPARQSGAACFGGTRVPVAIVMSLPDEAIADWYPSVTPEHIKAMRWWLAQPGVEEMLRRSL